MRTKSEIFNSLKTKINGVEVLTYGNAIKAMEECENLAKPQSYVPKCSQCGDKFWIYNNDGTRQGCTCHN